MNVGVMSTLGHITDLMSVSRAAVAVCMLLAPVMSVGDKIYKRLSVIFWLMHFTLPLLWHACDHLPLFS